MIGPALIALFISTIVTGAAMARPPANPDPALAPWYEGLRQPGTGAPCCSMADCRNVNARSTKNGYQVLVSGAWIDVPPRVVLNVSNPTGMPVACWIQTPAEKGAMVTIIMCFVPGPMT